MKIKYQFVPEWEKDNHFLVYPEFKHYQSGYVRKFYDEFLVFLSHFTNLYNILPHIPVTSTVGALKVKRIHLEMRDIWIKDWAPIPVYEFGTKKKSFAKFIYLPSYNLSLKDSRIDNKAGSKLANIIDQPIHNYDFYLEGGNLVTDGKNIILTQRVLKENKINAREFERYFNERFEYDRLLMIPEEPGDLTGHVDGIVRFIGNEIIVVGIFPEGFRKGREYSEQIYKKVMSRFHNTHSVIRIKNSYNMSRCREFPGSAYGNRVNFLQIRNNLFIPDYGILDDQKEYESLYELLPIYYFIHRVKGVSGLSDHGGVLNCITWGY